MSKQFNLEAAKNGALIKDEYGHKGSYILTLYSPDDTHLRPHLFKLADNTGHEFLLLSDDHGNAKSAHDAESVRRLKMAPEQRTVYLGTAQYSETGRIFNTDLFHVELACIGFMRVLDYIDQETIKIHPITIEI